MGRAQPLSAGSILRGLARYHRGRHLSLTRGREERLLERMRATIDARLNHVVALAKLAKVEGSLIREVSETPLQDLLKQISVSCKTLTELRCSQMPRRKERHDSVEGTFALSAMVDEIVD